MRFSTRLLVVQLATQVCVVAICAGVFTALGVQQLRTEAQATALGIARSVSEAPEVRRLVAAYSADPGTPDAASLVGGELQHYAAAASARTGALFVVVTDDHGVRLAHPDPSRLGEVVSTSFADALAGREVVSWESGTLGDSARAKVPVAPPVGGAPVGEVSVGFESAGVFDDVPALVGAIGVTVLAALAIGAGVAALVRRRLERLTLGLQPEELAALVQTQSAVLESSEAGVVALDPDDVVRVWNPAAARMLGVTDAVGRALSALGLPEPVADALRRGAPDGVAAHDRIVYVDVRPVARAGRALGTAAVLRDRTDVLALTDRLQSVRALSDALRVERHEFANRLHAASGLLAAGRTNEAEEFLREIAARGSVDRRVDGMDAVTDAVLQSFLGAKAVAARERDVALRVGDDTLLRGALADVEDALAVLGNLVDNAITAAARGPEPRWVEVTLLDDRDELAVSVVDSGPGIPPGTDPFAPRERADDDAAAVHGLGVGMPLSRELARRRGGDVWVVDPGGDGSGAVVAARIPSAMAAGRGEEER